MSIDAAHAIEELVANGFAGDGSAGGENFFDGRSMAAGRLLRREPIRTAAAGAAPRDVVHILDDSGQSGERAGSRANNRRIEIMRDKERSFHAACFLYQSRIRTPSQAATPGLLNTASKARRT